jgi:hypothetical protein
MKLSFGANKKAEGISGETASWYSGLTSEILQRAMLSFDRSTIVIVATVWSAAIIMIVVALYTLSLSGSAHRAMEEALAAEPVLPKIERTDNNREDARKMVDRLKKKYDGISFENSNEGQIGFIAANPENFSTWLAALTYLDTIAPDTRWSLASMCVGGECGPGAVMSASVTGQRITFSVVTPPAE